MPLALDICCELPEGIEEDVEAFVDWLKKRYPLRRRYTMQVWVQVDGICCEQDKGIHAAVFCPNADRLLPQTRLDFLETIAHEIKHLHQSDARKEWHHRGVEAWAAARVREARREGII